MKPSRISASCIIAAAFAAVQSTDGQVINATMQSGASRMVASRAAPVAKPIANTAIAPHMASRPTTISHRIVNSSALYSVGQLPINPQRIYLPAVRSSNGSFAALNAQRASLGQQPIIVDPATRQAELRTLCAMRERRVLGPRQPITLDPATRETELRTLSAMRERHGFATQNQTLATINPQRQVTTHDPAAAPQPETRESLKDTQAKKSHHRKDEISYDEAFRRHWHEWHDRNWWHNHCDTIVFVNTGYYFLDGSYWYPAYGYDPLNSYYDYDGPVYTYSNLLPDEVIANVQTALQDAGYYYGEITGSLGVDTRAALANFQRDYGLPITGAIDEATVEALGLYQTDDANNFQTDQGY